ncbi:hypothetical protein [Sporichthya polymorpha]|uniref:hypothetical protein n=1 Tax=Sporichthya polymorpha TaxID=35751 RepID=UPI000381457C|nr:hypothetical protein [Sporichthya polymorpha]
MIVGLSGTASAEDTRFNLEARGDAFYFEVNGDEIPVSPNNDAGSLTASARTTNSGGSDGFAGMPYWGSTAQHAPGTVNGVPNQFGLGQVQLPFAVLPGYVSTSSSGTPEAEEDFGYGRIKSVSTPTSATSSASYGAPATIPAPNQQQTANAATESKGTSVSAVASGSSAGFVTGPLEVGNSTALASITQTVGKPAKIESKTFGRFAVNGQEFGFDQNGFRYLGQGMSSKDALGQANSALKNAGIQIDLAPVVTSKDATGKTIYSIGGLMVTATQASPTGAGTFTVKYILGRAKVGASVATLGYGTTNNSPSAGNVGGNVDGASADAGAGSDVTDNVSGLDAAGLSPELATEAAGTPATVATITEGGTLAPVPSDIVGTASGEELPRTLGFVPVAGQTGEHSEWLYAMLLVAGAALVGSHFLFTRFASSHAA